MGDDRVLIVEGATQTTMVVAARDGGVYYSVQAGNRSVEQSCMDMARATPHLQSLQAALESVKSVADSRDGSNTVLPAGCSADRAWAFVFQGMPLVLCQTQTGAFLLSGEGVTGSIYDIDTEVASESPILPVFNMTSGSLMECPQILAVRETGARQLLRWVARAPTSVVNQRVFYTIEGIKLLEITLRVTQCWDLASSKGEAASVLQSISQSDRSACQTLQEVTYRSCALYNGVEKCVSCAYQPATDKCWVLFIDAASPPQLSSTFTAPTVPRPRLLSDAPSEFSASKLPHFKRCVFMHGPGVLPAADAARSGSTFPEYWGDADTHVGCSQSVFLQLDTTNQPWDSPVLGQQFCNAVASATTRSISNTIVFVHGSGNLVIGAAVAAGQCSFEQSSAWVELQASSNAARMSEVAADICSYRESWDARQQAMQAENNYCVGQGTTLSPGWASVLSTYQPAGVTWAQVADVIKSHVSGAMCGDHAPGLLDSTQWAVAPQLPEHHRSASVDVNWSTCWDVEYRDRFSVTDSTSAFYAPSVNYWDVTCRNGDGMYGSHRQPCGWMASIAHK